MSCVWAWVCVCVGVWVCLGACVWVCVGMFIGKSDIRNTSYGLSTLLRKRPDLDKTSNSSRFFQKTDNLCSKINRCTIK